MPLVTISLRRGSRSPAERAAIRDGVYRALRDTFDVPEHDRFVLTREYDAEDFDVDPVYGGMQRGPGAVIVELTVSNTRSLAQKKALFACLAELLAERPGLRGDDLFVVLTEVAKENWSFGNGIAQYAET